MMPVDDAPDFDVEIQTSDKRAVTTRLNQNGAVDAHGFVESVVRVPLSSTSIPGTSDASLTSCGNPRCDSTTMRSTRSSWRNWRMRSGTSSSPNVNGRPVLCSGGDHLVDDRGDSDNADAQSTALDNSESRKGRCAGVLLRAISGKDGIRSAGRPASADAQGHRRNPSAPSWHRNRVH